MLSCDGGNIERLDTERCGKWRVDTQVNITGYSRYTSTGHGNSASPITLTSCVKAFSIKENTKK